ncbi:MAG TPA: DUF4410 domain-containing protein [Candidatus Binatia bacterium]|jgi:hypothetical protein|nr:DUF4410 domain-containing protein [Candidatus Binatia bacterium]
MHLPNGSLPSRAPTSPQLIPSIEDGRFQPSFTRFIETVLTVLALAVVPACGTAPLAPGLGPIGVVPFSTDPSALAISRYEGDTAQLGSLLATQAVTFLKRRDRDAQVAPQDSPIDSGTIVSGRITRLDGGNRALRALVGFGAGGSTCAADGTVSRADGTRIGTFALERKRKGTGFFWVRFGESAELQLQKCVESLGNGIGQLVDQGKWTPAPAAVSPTLSQPAPPSQRTTQDRLVELDELKSRGLITDREYEEKRKRILEEF